MPVIYENYGCGAFDLAKFEPIKNRWLFNKPKGGFWASAKDDEWGWAAFCVRENYRTISEDDVFRFTLKPDAKILLLDDPDLFFELPEKKTDKDEEECRRTFPFYPDFEKLAKEYDVIDCRVDCGVDACLPMWDVNCILVMNPDVICPM